MFEEPLQTEDRGLSPGKKIATTFLEFLSTKLELLQVELEEEKRHVVGLLVSVLLGCGLVLFGVTLMVVAGAILINAQWGPWGVLLFGAIVTVSAGIIFWQLFRSVKVHGTLFTESIRELKNDIEWLKRQI
ncbi:MAG: phage holin family protein [Verrucomicrobiota bacterium]|nr:phage holin family protein [Verrucomicrobiota bacterium]